MSAAQRALLTGLVVALVGALSSVGFDYLRGRPPRLVEAAYFAVWFAGAFAYHDSARRRRAAAAARGDYGPEVYRSRLERIAGGWPGFVLALLLGAAVWLGVRYFVL
jgi:hypothetical protein